MANDIREQAYKKFEDEHWPESGGDDGHTCSHCDSWAAAFMSGYDAGHAAATAEGIPQADGWVAIETGGLPGIGGEYIVAYTPSDGELPPIIETVAEFCSKSRGVREKYDAGKWYYVGSRALEFTGVVAWQEIPPYQRPTEEQGAKR